MILECEKCKTASILNCFCGHETLLPVLAWKSGTQTAVLKILPPPITWTREKPTEPGWYWMRFQESAQIVLVRGGHVFHSGTSTAETVDYHQQLGTVGVFWAGPLTPPEEENL